jgi:hypothetical protein
MKKPVITLYVNDPMGRKCQANFAAASQAQAAFGVELVIVKDCSPEYRPGVDPPVASVVVDGTLLVQADTVTFESLQAAIRALVRRVEERREDLERLP